MIGKRIRSRLIQAVYQAGRWSARIGLALRENRLVSSFPDRMAVRTIRKFGDDDAPQLAASVSFYAVLCVFPLVLALLSIIGWVAGSESRQNELVDYMVSNLPGSEQFMSDSLEDARRLRTATGVIATLGLIWSATAVMGSISWAVNRAWGVREDLPFFKSKPRHVVMALGVGVLFIASVALTSFVQWASSIEIGAQTANDILDGRIVKILLRISALLISLLIFASIYKFLPSVRVFWRAAWTGALFAAVLFELSKSVFLWYLEHFAQFDQIYGGLASIVILMIWAYVSAVILIAGAELSYEYSRSRLAAEMRN